MATDIHSVLVWILGITSTHCTKLFSSTITPQPTLPPPPPFPPSTHRGALELECANDVSVVRLGFVHEGDLQVYVGEGHGGGGGRVTQREVLMTLHLEEERVGGMK